jgi:hypothetical protein
MVKVESLRGVVPSYATKDIHAVAAAALKMNPGRARTETGEGYIVKYCP